MRKLCVFLPLLLFGLGGDQRADAQTSSAGKSIVSKNQAQNWIQEDPTGFIENKGQFTDQAGKMNAAVKYLLHMPGLNVQLRPSGFSYDTWVDEKSGERKFHRVDIELDGANVNAVLATGNQLADAENIISDHGRFEGIHSFRTITYRNIYPGIDLEFVAKKGTDKPVEYNFIVHPGADASQIKMKYNSGSDISLKNGMIEMDLAFGKLKEKIPASYTQQDKHSLAVQYKPLNEDANLYAFNVPVYDHSKTLVIDPTPSLAWSTYNGGNGGDVVNSVSADASGNIYIAGTTTSTNLISTIGTFQNIIGGNTDFFLTKFNAAGIRQWGTYIGGSSAESIQTAAISVSGSDVYFTGTTASSGLATTGAFQTAPTGTSSAYLAKFNSSNGTIAWGTYFSGASGANSGGLITNADGSVYLTGYTSSTTGIATSGTFQTTLQGTTDAFVARFEATGSLTWASYLGGNAIENARGVTTDASGNIYVTGLTGSTSGLATTGAFQTTLAGGNDIFLSKINSTGTALLWSTYWGGNGNEFASFVKVDPSGNIAVVGATGTATNNPLVTSNGLASPGAMNTSPLGGRDVLIGKFSPSGSRLWSTYYGGANNDMTVSADLDENGNILIVGDGFTSGPASLTGNPSTNLATNCTYQSAIAGGNEVFISKISNDGNTKLWSTYFGASGDERAFGIKYLGNGNFAIGGTTNSTSGLTSLNVQQTAFGGATDGFLARFNEGTAPSDLAVAASAISPLTQTACVQGIPGTITGNAVTIYNPPTFTSPIFYQWQEATSATGPWTNISGEVYKDLQPLPAATTLYYRRLILVNNGLCDKKTVDSSAVATVTLNTNTAPIAHADGPQWYVCGTGSNTVTLNGSATGGTGIYSSYQWYAGSDLTNPVATTASYTPTVTANTTYTLKVTDNAGCVDVDQVAVVPAIANAGADISMCENSSGIQIGTAGTPDGAVTYSWTSISGDPASSLSCTNCAQPIAHVATTSVYRLTTTVTRKDGTTCNTTDDVTVTFVAAPTGGASFGGTDKTICKGSIVALGSTNDATATYSWSPTAYLSTSTLYNPTFDAGTAVVPCPMTYTVTATKGGCAFTDQVNITVIDASTDQDNQTLTCGAWASGNTHNCSGATYSWQLISGSGVTPTGTQLRNGGADAYLINNGGTNAVYLRTTTLNGVSCNSGQITVAPCTLGNGCPSGTIKLLSPQGCPKVFNTQDLQLYVDGVNASDYDFSWTPAGIMDNATSPVVTITSTTATTVSVTLTNKYTGQVCSVSSIAINDPSWTLPTLNVTNKATCPGTSVLLGEAAAAGYSYSWLPVTGLNLPAIAQPTATLSDSVNYTVTKVDIISGCQVSATVKVNVSSINFDAGADHAVCNGATVTLGTVPGGNYTYSWTPTNAAWTNGTGPTNANPQVLFANTAQTFNVTVTDPATGCQKTDAVTLSGVVATGEYAGIVVDSLCPGGIAPLGKTPVTNATYQWTPTTGLSCATCAQPTVTAENTTQTYYVTVSYPGCSTPVTDSVIVPVHIMPAVTLADQNICPSTATNIGIGGTSNTASLPTAISYSWSPATNMSCVTCASPLANPVAVTNYTVLITYANGCIYNDTVVVTPTVQVSAKPNATICPGGTAVLGSPSQPNITYAWTVISGTTSSLTTPNIAQPTVNPNVTSVYELSATGTGPNAGCTLIDDVQVTVKTLPTFSISGPSAICAGGTATLSVTPTTANTIYQWSPAATVASPTSASTAVNPSAATTYRVTQTDLNSGCSNYQETIVTVSANNLSATGGDLIVCPSTSATMPLTVSPATGNTIVWTPATNLSDAYAQNPVVTPLSSGDYIATVTNNTSNCVDTALVTVTVPTSCLAYDFGDAPLIYEGGNPASHGVNALLKIGTATDAESAPVSALMNALAIGDDDNNVINDEEGIRFLPGVNTGSQTIGMLVNSVFNNTGNPAYLAAWIDFNHDGDFNDAGEQSAVLTIPSSTTATSPLLQFNGFNNGCSVVAGTSYLRVRLTTDTTNGWNKTPLPTGVRADGEVEDYSILITGADFGDAPAIYPAVRALVYPDLNNDGKPDSTGSVWLGNLVDYVGCEYVASATAVTDDNTGLPDEDGLDAGTFMSPNVTQTWNLTVNSQGPVNGVQWGMWIDWDGDGTFDAFYNDSVNTASPVVVPISVISPANSANYVVRVGVRANTAFTAADFTAPITNGEWEDYIAPLNPLAVYLTSFTATKNGNTGLLQWTTDNNTEGEYFKVERSIDGQYWEELGRVNAIKTAGAMTYHLTDNAPVQGRNYYRLRIIATDGSYKLSPVRQLNFGKIPVTISVLPNPAHDIATVAFSEPTSEDLSINLVDGLGQLITTYKIPSGTTRYALPSLAGLARGVYYLDVKGNTTHDHFKLILQ
ncbi:DUF7948 domain-containing protein [Taibaiella soli]|uniref:Ig-like domain-containing protein n=1 Tax=Taibaiella soli TaxID=1649169 RepID=A0A2W2ANV4_9BACT|nr:GEVED domain-containing protein [Taibaiella soli]PZF74050.1 hypothetical protein DN068_04985 [Taibaiella soli]